MGAGVAQVPAQGGHRVALVDVSAGALTRGRRDIETNTRLQGLFGPAATPAAPVLEAITFTQDYDALSEAAFVIENVAERGCPRPLLRIMVDAGLPGRKSGREFYDYSTDP
jgi:3-hydroxybutyryl-CoA dehydrogenase